MAPGALEGRLVKNVYAGNLLEVFLVTAVASILTIRFFLSSLGYPQVSGGGLHIAHVLVGGMFMLLAMVILLSFLDKWSRDVAAVLGGFGFGAFIDELGKFITSDNNYFFQPTVGLIYITFVLLYLLAREIDARRILSREERLANVLEISKEAVLDRLDPQEKQTALSLLDESDSSDPVAMSIKESLQKIEASPTPAPGMYSKAKARLQSLYQRAIKKSWFTKSIVIYFLLQSVISLLEATQLTVGISNALIWVAAGFAILGIYRAFASKISVARKILYSLGLIFLGLVVLATVMNLELPKLSIVDWAQMGFTALAGSFSVAGIFRIRKSRLLAFNHFKTANLIYIFFVQVFNFFDVQFYGLIGLGINITTFLVLKYMISQEMVSLTNPAISQSAPNRALPPGSSAGGQ